ncbi:MAG: alpha/beta fold hydrolase [Acidobacteriota bacterium]
MRIFLIHGMGRTPASMWLLSQRLRRAGHRTSTFGYTVTLEGLETIGERFLGHIRDGLAKERARSGGAEPEFAVVGHSLGNVVTRMVSPRLPAGFGGFVMLAPPNRSPAMARLLGDNPVFQAVTQDAGRKLVDDEFFERLPVPDVPALIIAGTRGPQLRWLPFGEQAHDAVVGVDEARLDGIPLVEVPAVHTFLMNRGDVFALIREFLDRRTAHKGGSDRP